MQPTECFYSSIRGDNVVYFDESEQEWFYSLLDVGVVLLG